MAVKKQAQQTVFPDVYLKPGIDNLLIALQAIVDGKLPANAVGIKINVLREWAHRTKQQAGENHGLIIKNRKGV